jgi:hypothetical protein
MLLRQQLLRRKKKTTMMRMNNNKKILPRQSPHHHNRPKQQTELCSTPIELEKSPILNKQISSKPVLWHPVKIERNVCGHCHLLEKGRFFKRIFSWNQRITTNGRESVQNSNQAYRPVLSIGNKSKMTAHLFVRLDPFFYHSNDLRK